MDPKEIQNAIDQHFSDVRTLAESYLQEHEGLQRFVVGFGKFHPCSCHACEAARRLLAHPAVSPSVIIAATSPASLVPSPE